MKGYKRKYRKGYLSFGNEGLLFSSTDKGLFEIDQTLQVKVVSEVNRAKKIVEAITIISFTIILSFLLLKFVPALLAVPILLFGLPMTYAMSVRKFSNTSHEEINMPMQRIQSAALVGTDFKIYLDESKLHFIIENDEDIHVMTNYLRDLDFVLENKPLVNKISRT